MHRVFQRSGHAVAALVGGMLAILLSLTLTVQSSFAYSAKAYSIDDDKKTENPDWMGGLPDTVRLSWLSLPGTHDTLAVNGTYKGAFRGLVVTQTLPLDKQLESGIRVLDIRCRHIDDFFAIHHGAFFLNAWFGGDVLDPVIAFLQAHPTETILMRIKEEHTPENNTREFRQTFEWYMNSYGAHYFWKPTAAKPNPTLADVRGKIVVLDNFSKTAQAKLVKVGLTDYGIQWGSLAIQDAFEICGYSGVEDKKAKIRAQIDAADTDDAENIYVNFLSGTMKLGCEVIRPSDVANRTNSYAYNYLAHTRPWRSGSIMADFPGPDLIDMIIGLNAFVPTAPAAQGDDMQAGEALHPDQWITSANGRYTFIYQSDGNLVLYDDDRPLWASGTAGSPVGVTLMQDDGNLVIYTRGSRPIWSSDTWQYPGSRLVVQDDGNVVIYDPYARPVWATNTMQP